MADQVDVPVKDEEEKIPEEVKEYRAMHEASVKAILAEKPEEAKTDDNKPEEPKEEPKPEVKEEPKVEEPKVDTEAIAKEAATKAAEEALAKQREEDTRKLDEAKKAEEAEKLKQEMRPKWEWDNDPTRKKDENGKPLPLSYEEVAEEGRRLGKLDAIQEVEAREAKRAQEAEEIRKAEETKNAEIKQRQDEFNKQLQSEMDSDLNDLYLTDKLPKIKDENDPNDPGLLARNTLFQTGIKVNQERAAKGLPPIRSIKLVYYEHYKSPGKQPAGHDAPVMGNTPPPANPHDDNDEYDWVKDHNKSPRQMLSEMRAKAGKN